MGEDTKFCASNILQYLMYIALIALCLTGILYLLFHARPQIAPKVKQDTNSQLLRPLLPPARAALTS